MATYVNSGNPQGSYSANIGQLFQVPSDEFQPPRLPSPPQITFSGRPTPAGGPRAGSQPINAPGGRPSAPPPGGPPPARSQRDPFDLSSDPLLREFYELERASLKGAGAKRTERQRQIVLRIGSKLLAEKLFGKEDPILQLISDDPYKAMSELAISRRGEVENRLAANENLNQQGLFFSSFRGKTLGDISRERILRDAGILQGGESELQGVNDLYDQTVLQFALARRQAESEAFFRNLALYGSGFGGDDGGSGFDVEPDGAPPPLWPAGESTFGLPKAPPRYAPYGAGAGANFAIQ